MKILLLDPQRKTNYRISKDTSGGYGTGNDFGNSLIPKILKYLMKKNCDWPPIFAAYTHSVLSKKGHEVVYSKKIPDNYNSFDLFVVITSIVCCETELLAIKSLTEKNKKVFAIGPFATNMSKVYSEAGATVISGEPEFYFLGKNNFEEDLNKNIVFFKHNFRVDDLPFPSWDKVVEKFDQVNRLFGNYKSVPFLATRGCPYSCSRYCVYPLQQGKIVRQRSIKNIIDEIEYWKKNFNVKMFIFRDPVFSINRKHTIQFCDELYNKKLNIKFVIETHLRILDSELIQLLIKCGLKAVKVGVESAATNVLKKEGRFTVKKDEQLSKIRELEKNNIQVSAMFIIGFPSDEDSTIRSTIDYAKFLNTTYAQFSIWTPYPGTPVFNEFKDKIIKNDYESFNQYNLVYKHNRFTGDQVKNYLDLAYTKYYLRVSWLYKYLKSFVVTA